METYSFWQDFFSTYRASSEPIKALWLIAPAICFLGCLWIVINRPRP